MRGHSVALDGKPPSPPSASMSVSKTTDDGSERRRPPSGGFALRSRDHSLGSLDRHQARAGDSDRDGRGPPRRGQLAGVGGTAVGSCRRAGNLSVTVDARGLSVSDPALVWIFQIVEREAALRAERFISSSRHRTARRANQIERRPSSIIAARRIAALGKAAHPARGAPTTQTEEERSST